MAKLGPLPDVAGVCKIRLIGQTAAGTPWVNVLHAKTTGSLTTATLNGVAAAIRPFWTGDLAPVMTTNTTLATVEVTDLSSRTGNQGLDQVGGAGASATTPYPANVAVALTLKIANRYRGGHPRMYLPGVPGNASSNGRTLNSTNQNAYTNAGRAFLTHINSLTIGSTTWALAAVSYYHKVGGIEAYKVPPDVYVITDIICHGRLDSMRRRLGKETS
jgi:hypothetical protein